MNKDELVGYIQGLLDMNKRAQLLMDLEFQTQEMDSKLLVLINKALIKHRNSLKEDSIKTDAIKYFNRKADEYNTPNEKDPIWNGPSDELLGPEISSHGKIGKDK